MAHTRVTAHEGPGSVARASRPTYRRRRLIVDARAQLRASLSTVAIVAVLLGLLNLALYQMSRLMTESLAEVAPELTSTLATSDRVRMAVSLACSVVLVFGFAALRLAESTRTFGAAQRLAASLRELAGGRSSVRVALRRHDTLHEVADAVNELAESMGRQARDELDSLEKLVRVVEDPAHRQVIPRELGHGLGELVASKRRQLL